MILAEADRDAARLRGDGEAQAISILAESLNKDPEFFSFQRSLEAYKTFLNQRTTVILSSDADIFQFLQSPGSGSSQTTGGGTATSESAGDSATSSETAGDGAPIGETTGEGETTANQ